LKRIVLLLATFVVLAIGSPSVAFGAVCGQREQTPSQGPASKSSVSRASLTLNVDASTTSKRFGRSEKTRRLIFDYTVSGCDIPDDAPTPSTEVLPHGSNELPEDAVDIGSPRLQEDNLQVTVKVDPTKFGPDKYDLVFRVSAPYLARQNTPAYVSRSDAAFWKPLTAVLAGALVAFGLGAAGVASKVTGALKVRWVWLAVALAATLIAGFYVMFAAYWSNDVEVWKWPDDWAKTAALAFGAGSAGAIAGLLANVFKESVAPAKPKHKLAKPKHKPTRPKDVHPARNH
jgi:hypothetical protein